MLSIIIPSFNEAASIDQLLAAIAKISEPVEVMVVDGGSNDETIPIARERGVRLITSERGRGVQMHAGACEARGEVLWFLHADTQPPADGAQHIAKALRDPHVVSGNFNVSFDSGRFAARFLTRLYRQLRRLGLCYGDSAIFVRRETYERAGGFKPFPIFEDLDLVRRLRKYGRMVNLPASVITSSRRFDDRSFVLTFARWTFLQVLYWTGINPRTLGKLYEPIRRTEIVDSESPGRSLDGLL
jgi:rSAM/selenodomain-associated transferase 2